MRAGSAFESVNGGDLRPARERMEACREERARRARGANGRSGGGPRTL